MMKERVETVIRSEVYSDGDVEAERLFMGVCYFKTIRR